MQRVMLYCQYLSGMGHLVRSTQFAAALSDQFETLFINGGPPIEGFQHPDGIELTYLPPLWLENGKFKVASDGASVETVKNQRRDLLIAEFDRFRPDVVITEFFPFGRHDLLFELEPWMQHIQATAPETLVVSSLRDLIGKTVLNEQLDLIADLANRYFDLALIHSDAQFLSFQECFPGADRLSCAVAHGGFIAQPNPDQSEIAEVLGDAPGGDQPFVLVSVGGGRIGGALLDCAVAAAAALKDETPHLFRLFTGPFLEDSHFQRLVDQAAGMDNVVVERFTPDLSPFMAATDLSISLAGYNTTMNVLRAAAPAIFVPIGHYDFDCEQLMRAKKLQDLGLAAMIPEAELTTELLVAAIREGLAKPRPTIPFNLDGAAAATAEIAQHLAQKRAGLSAAKSALAATIAPVLEKQS